MSADNSSLLDSLFSAPLCDGWSNNTEGAVYHLGNTFLFLGYMGGSGAYGCLFIFGFLTPAFACLALWGWMTVCGLDVFSWNLLLLLACLAQICYLLFRLHQEGIRSEELTSLYQAVYLPLGVPVEVFKEITAAFEGKVVELKAGETYALEGKTPIDQLSFLLSGRWECVSVILLALLWGYKQCCQRREGYPIDLVVKHGYQISQDWFKNQNQELTNAKMLRGTTASALKLRQ